MTEATITNFYYVAAATVTGMTPWEYWTWPPRFWAILVYSTALIYGLVLIGVLLFDRRKKKDEY